MSVEAITVVLNHSKAKGSQKLVLLGIANHHSDEGAWPAVATLARYSNLSERRVQQMIRELADMGELGIDEQGGGGNRKYKTNRYWILATCPSDCTGFPKHQGVKPISPRGEARFALGVKPVSPETPLETKENHQKEFDVFWQKYPRHENKVTAIKAYEKAVKKTNHIELLKKLDEYIAHNEKNQIKFAFAATWLNQERWLDEFDEVLVRQDKSKEHTKQMLADMAELEKLVGIVPRCKHDKNPALCRECYTQK